ncbi:Ig-like domain repeat protein [Candidatus Bathyarchaeota archaeon]|nr:Ig-like domain repeat protein [Candidatus Bathyarchaeota archaeon]
MRTVHHRSVILCVAIFTLITPIFHEVLCSEIEAPIRIAKDLHIHAPKPDDYAYMSRDITPIPVDGEFVEFQASVKLLRLQSTPLGFPLQIDLRGFGDSLKAHELRYSFRFSNDGSIVFFYPFMNSSAAVAAQRAWIPGKWYHLRTVVSDGSAEFYVNGSLKGRNTPQLPARSSGFVISQIGFGKPERQKIGVDAFIASVIVAKNGEIRISEDFEGSLDAYEIRSSGEALLEPVDPSRYALLDACARPTTVSIGDTIMLTANLLDSSLEGIGDRTITFECQSGDKWLGIATATTLSNGTAKTSWTVQVIGNILVHARFAGDEHFSQTSSTPIMVAVARSTTPRFEISNLLLPSFVIIFLCIALSAFRFGHMKVLHLLVSFLSSLVLVFSLSMLTNSVEIKSFVGYTPRTVRIVFLGGGVDEAAWVLSSLTLAGAWIVLRYQSILKYRKAIIPVLLIATSLGFSISGADLAASLLGIISALLTALFPVLFRRRLEIQRPWASALEFTASFLTIISIVEIGSAAGWIYNIFDPHVPIDGESRWIAASLEMNLFGLFYPVTMVALVAMMFSWAWMPCLSTITRSVIAKLRNESALRDHPENCSLISKPSGARAPLQTPSRRRSALLWLLFAVAVSACAVFLVYYPYTYARRLIGVDTPWYYQNLIAMSTSGGLEYLASSYGAASRMPYLLILYVLTNLTSLPADVVVRVGPAVPAAFLAVTTLFLVRTITQSDLSAILSSFLGLFSIATTVGIYAGIFANWLALGWAALLLGLLLTLWRRQSTPKLLLTLVVSFILLATHAWTWAVILTSLLTFVILRLLYLTLHHRGLSGDLALKSSLITAAANLLLLTLILSHFPTGEFVHLSKEAIASISVSNLWSFPVSFAFTVQYYVGGFIANPAVILLAIAGLTVGGRFDKNLGVFLFSMLMVTSIPLILVGSWWQWRLLYMIPYQVLATLGIQGISQKISEPGDGSGRLCQGLLMMTILLSSFNYALRCLNFIPS